MCHCSAALSPGELHRTALRPPSIQRSVQSSDVCVCVCLLSMGSGALDYRQQAQQMELRTGGMSVSTQVIADSAELDVYEQVGTGNRFLLSARAVGGRSCPPTARRPFAD